jgi:hypothetical protein
MVDINEIWKFELRKGNSKNPREGACLLDAVSWLEYGTLGDHPACVCPVIAAFGRGINDAMSDEGRQRLKLFIPRLVGTVDPEHERERAEYLAWQAIRVFAPLALDAVGQHKHATVLRNFTGSLAEAAWAAGAAAEAAAWAAWAAAGAAEAARAATAEAAARATAGAAAEAAWAAAAAAWAAWAAAGAAGAAAEAAWAAAEDAMISALEGVLAIGRQAEPVEPARFDAAVRLFEEARG